MVSRKLPMVLYVDSADGMVKVIDLLMRRYENMSFLPAASVEAAQQMFDKNWQDLNAIVVDACPDKDFKITTLQLVRNIRERLTTEKLDIPVIATSPCDDFRKELILAGCDYEIDDKLKIPQFLLELLSR